MSEDFSNDVFQSRFFEINGISRCRIRSGPQTHPIALDRNTPGGYSRTVFQRRVSLKGARRLVNAGVSVQRFQKSARLLRWILPTVRRSLADWALMATGVRKRTA